MKKTILQIGLLLGFVQFTHAQKDTLFRYKCRIGINSGIGTGFGAYSVPLVKLSDGTNSSINFGGGTIAQLKYGYEFNSDFDLLFDLSVQISELDKPISNGSVYFQRFYFSVTPSFIVPILGGQRMRMKFGGGLAYYYSPVLVIDLSKIQDGVSDDWRYKNTIGEHLTIMFERNTRKKRFSFNAGFKYYLVHYHFDKGNISYPIDPKLKKANGSGLDFVMGFNYHF